MKSFLIPFLVLAALGSGCNSPVNQPISSFTAPVYTSWMISEDVVALYKKVVVSVYSVEMYDEQTKTWEFCATAFAVTHNKKSYILTAKHVVNDEGKYRLKTGGKTYEMLSSILDPDSDTAIMVMKDFVPKFSLPLASKNPEVGAACWAFGNPLDFQNVVTDGIVSQYEEEGDIISSTHIAPGSSGGPLVNAKGELIGISSRMIPSYNSLNFFVAIAKINKFISKQ